MNDSFDRIKNIIENGKWGIFLPPELDSIEEPCHRRLLKALESIGEKYEPTSIELAGSIRHFLRHEDEKNPGGMSRILKVPRSFPYPADREIWQRCGMDILQESNDFFLLTARPWKTDWLASEDSPEKNAFAGVKRRDYTPIEGDKFLQLVGLTSYRSIGQKEAIRAILTAPPNATLLVNLPTGSGKSLCAQIPALLKRGVTIVIVPTVALAIDQERSLQSIIPYPTAYYYDESPTGQQRREEIRQRIRQGTQRIVFTSPESLIRSLSPCLHDAARRGYLNHLIIDEVHIVEQWGDEFRPVFQEISGLFRHLSRITTFQTILLTATLTESCLETIETLFRGSGEFQILSAVQLRPEPSYWFAKCRDDGEKQRRLLEAIDHLPRPIIIYTTRKKDAYDLRDLLKKEGFQRLDVMTGESSAGERLKLIDNWRQKNIDIVIATSAFGLGMDQQDVRTVIHACIPETIDRFYQEVGRGGRDGNASISLTLYTDKDNKTAAGLNEKTYITKERGLERWTSMFDRKETIGDGHYRVKLDVPPSFADKDIDMNSSENRDWNSRTLTLMSQAGLIELDWENPPRPGDYPSDTDYQKAFETYQNSRVIRIRNEYHRQPETWENYIEPIRQKRQENNTRNLDLLRETLGKHPTRCLAEIFQEAYTIPAVRSREKTRKKVNVSAACGGCPWCRQYKNPPFSRPMPHPRPVWQNPDFSVGKELQRLFNGENILLIFYETISPEKLDRLIHWFIGQGIINIISPVSLENHIPRESIVFIEREYQPFTLSPVPTLIYHPPSLPLPRSYLYPVSFPHAILLPENTPDPERFDRRLIDIFPGRGFRLPVFSQEIHL